MSDQLWIISLNGQQLDGQHGADGVDQVVLENPGGAILVWKEGMETWVDPATLPEFKAPQAAAPPPPPAKTAPPPPSPGPSIHHPKSSRSAGGLAEKAGFFKALFDIKFDSFVTPKIISILYVIVMILIGLGFIAMLISGFGSIFSGIRFSRMGLTLLGIFWLVLSPVLTIIYLAFTRMFFEIVIVLFKIKDNTAKIAEK